VIYEYAVEPSLLNTWNDFRYFVEQFGVSRGRLISRYPGKWERMVHESLSSCSPIEKAKIVERLMRIQDRMITRQSVWNPQKEWLPNAEDEHGRKPFRAILARTNPRAQGFVLEGQTVNEDHPLWQVQVSLHTARSPEEVAACVGPLLSISRRIVFVDPYFRSNNYEYRTLFAVLLELAVRGRFSDPPSLGIFTSMKSGPNEQFLLDECRKFLPDVIPAGIQVAVTLWSQRLDGEEIHNRYILTDRGGVKFGNSLRQGDTGTTDDINLLGDDQYKLRAEQYVGPTPAFDRVNAITITGTRR